MILTILILITSSFLTITNSNFSESTYNNIDFERLDSLAIVECSQCVALPEGIGNSHLSYFAFSWNGFGSAEITFEEIGKITSLEYLDLGPYCQIQQLPVSFRNLSNLKRLNLTMSSIQCLPTWLNELESLEELDISLTLIRQLSVDNFENCNNLKYIYLFGTNVENLDDFVKELKAVRPDINVILDDIEMNYKINR